MFFKEWEVLIVDDEPDVIQVSRLAMRHFEVYGLPLKLHTAKSKAEVVDGFSRRDVSAAGVEPVDAIPRVVLPRDQLKRHVARVCSLQGPQRRSAGRRLQGKNRHPTAGFETTAETSSESWGSPSPVLLPHRRWSARILAGESVVLPRVVALRAPGGYRFRAAVVRRCTRSRHRFRRFPEPAP